MDKHTSSEETATPKTAEQETQHAPKPETVDQTKASIAPGPAPEAGQEAPKTATQEEGQEAPHQEKTHSSHLGAAHKNKKH